MPDMRILDRLSSGWVLSAILVAFAVALTSRIMEITRPSKPQPQSPHWLSHHPGPPFLEIDPPPGGNIFDRINPGVVLSAVGEPDRDLLPGESVDLFSRTAAIIPAAVGHVVVVPHSCTPIGSGYQVRFRISNPTSLCFYKYQLGASWGHAAPSTHIEPYADPIPPGNWREVRFVLAPALSNELSRVWITFEVLELSLGKAPTEFLEGRAESP